MDCLSPVAALAAVFEIQATTTLLSKGISLVTVIEMVTAGCVRVETI